MLIGTNTGAGPTAASFSRSATQYDSRADLPRPAGAANSAYGGASGDPNQPSSAATSRDRPPKGTRRNGLPR